MLPSRSTIIEGGVECNSAGFSFLKTTCEKQEQFY